LLCRYFFIVNQKKLPWLFQAWLLKLNSPSIQYVRSTFIGNIWIRSWAVLFILHLIKVAVFWFLESTRAKWHDISRRAQIFALLAANELNDLTTYLQNTKMERASERASSKARAAVPVRNGSSKILSLSSRPASEGEWKVVEPGRDGWRCPTWPTTLAHKIALKPGVLKIIE
jgi:hypothetical protein